MFWLELNSEPDAWRDGLPESTVREVLRRVTDEAVDDIIRELKTNGLRIVRPGLGDLLRHWIRIHLTDLSPTDDRGRQKIQKKAAKTLSKLMSDIDKLLRDNEGDLIYALALQLDHPQRISRSQYLCHRLRSDAHELLPAAERVANMRLGRGPSPDVHLESAIESLVEIFEFITGNRASRIYDPNAEAESGPLNAFVERCMRMLEPDADRSIDWAVRKVLRDRKQREESFKKATGNLDPFNRGA